MKPQKVLILSLSGIGDSILFSPALKLLHGSFPQWEIQVLVMFESAVDYYGRFPEISRIHCFDFVKQPKWKGIRFLTELRKEHFDLIINAYPANRTEYNLVGRFLGRRMAGHGYGHYNPANLQFLNHIRVQEEESRHPADENIALVRALGAAGQASSQLLFPLSGAERQKAGEWLQSRGLEHKVLIGIHPGSSTLKNHINKRWPAKRFSDLACRLRDRFNAEILIFGGPEEAAVMSEVASTMGQGGRLVTETSLGETAALIGRCRLFVSNDTALMHIAAALQIPCVPVFGPTDLRKGRPYHSPHAIALRFLSCSPCFYYSPRPLHCQFGTFECLRELPVEDVERCCQDLLESTAVAAAKAQS